ncbi:MAG: L,D-transpeptidase family protein [Bacteroidales bacterium]|nr:L,D-transpeptidase family protein [Bacteroidales bacterium]
MEKRTIYTSGKLTRINNILILIFLGGLILWVSSCKPTKSAADMDRHTTETSKLLARILKLNESGIGNSEQIILVTNDDIHSKNVTIQTFEKGIGGHWTKMFADIPGTIGRNGFSPFNQKREGDNASPTGIFNLGPVFGYVEKIATKMDYRQATDKDFWIDDPESDDYNTWVTMDTPPAVSHERMKLNNDLYKLGIVVQYNTKQVVKGNGSAIFVHIQGGPGSPTAGCVAMPEINLENIIQWLRPNKKPLIIMGTVSELEYNTL